MRCQFEEQQRQALRGARAHHDIRAGHRDTIGVRNRARLEQSFQLDALPLTLAKKRDHVRHGVDASNQKLAGDIDIGAVAQSARHDRLNHRQDVLHTMIEFVDHRGKATFEPDPHLDFAAEPQIVVGDISEKSADDAGQHKSDRGHDHRHLLRALHRVGLGVVSQRPVAATESHRSNHRWHRTVLTRDSRRDTAPIVGNQFAVVAARIFQHHREQRQIVVRQHQRRQLV